MTNQKDERLLTWYVNPRLALVTTNHSWKPNNRNHLKLYVH